MPYTDPNTGQTLYTYAETQPPGSASYLNEVMAAYRNQTPEQNAYVAQQAEAARVAALSQEQREAETLLPQIEALRSAPNLHSDEGRWAQFVDLATRYDALTPGDQSYLIEGAIQHSGVTNADIAREQYGSALTSQKAASGDTAAQAMVSSGAWQPGTEKAEKAASDIGIVAVQQPPVVLQGPVVINTNPEVPIGTVSQVTGNVWTGTGWGSQEQFYGSIISNANRPGYTPIQTLGDIDTRDLIFGYGYSPLQATIIQASIASNKFDATATRFYGNEAQKSFQDIVEISSGYHAWAKQTGLPQAPNPYEYAGDLSLAVLKGTNENSKSSVYGVAPVDYSRLNLPNGKGLQDVAWNAAIGYDRSGKYSVDYSKFLTAADVVTEAIISGNMGPYAALGKPYSSEYGTLSLAQQQEIATGVARAQGYAVHPEVPIPDYSFDWSVMGGTVLSANADEAMNSISPIVASSVGAGTSSMLEIGNTGTYVNLGIPMVLMPSGAQESTKTPASNAGILGSLFSEDNTFMSNAQNSIRTTFALSPGGMGLALVSDFAFGLQTGKMENLPFYDTVTKILDISKQPSYTEDKYATMRTQYEANIKQFDVDVQLFKDAGSTDIGIYNDLQSRYTNLQAEQKSIDQYGMSLMVQPTLFDKIGIAYESVNTGLVKYSTDILGVTNLIPEKGLPSYIPGDTSQVPYGDVINVPVGIITGFASHPLELPLVVAGGEIFKTAENVLVAGVARAATSEIPVIETLGRAGSTPLAADIGSVAKFAMGGAFIFQTGVETLEQPTVFGKSEVIGRASGQAIGFGIGYAAIPAQVPENPFAGREFFSGRVGFGPIEVARQDVSAYLNSFALPSELRPAYRGLPEYFRTIRGLEITPGISETNPAGTGFKSPDISLASTIGKGRAYNVGEALAESGTVLKGSIVMESQKSGTPLAELYRSPHDVDVIAANKELLEFNLAKRGETGAGLDIKGFEEGYPQIRGITDREISNEGISTFGLGNVLLGEPISTRSGIKLPTSSEVLVAGRDYVGNEGKLSQELLNVQFARKSQALMQDFMPAANKVGNVEARAMNEQFRIPKDYYDLQLMGRDISAMESIRGGKKPEYAPEANTYLEKLGGTRVDFDFMPKEDNPAIGAKAGEQFTKSMTLREIREVIEINAKAERQSPFGVGETQVKEYPPGIMESASSAVRSMSVMPSSVLSLDNLPSVVSVGAESPSLLSQSGSPSGLSRRSLSSGSPSISSLLSSEPGSSIPSLVSPSPKLKPSSPSSPTSDFSFPSYTPPSAQSISSAPSIPPSIPSIPSIPPSVPPSIPSIDIRTVPPYIPPDLYFHNIGVGSTGKNQPTKAGYSRRKWDYKNPIPDIPYLSEVSTKFASAGSGRKKKASRKAKNSDILDDFGM